jgi:hypothetical protein
MRRRHGALARKKGGAVTLAEFIGWRRQVGTLAVFTGWRRQVGSWNPHNSIREIIKFKFY